MIDGGPQFCPWCGSPMGYSEHPHQSRLELLIDEARERGEEPSLPSEIEDRIAGESFVGACQGCRILSHVISHRAGRGA